MKKICVYGKGGIGKSTMVTNVSAAMADMGLKVAVVGCDPKADTTRCLTGMRIPTVLDRLKYRKSEEIGVTGYGGILCIESGGPEPGTGCAGRGIAGALREIREQNLLAGRDAVIYDVLGDVVCGGFSTPLRENIANDVYLVTTADFMALYAANNICRGIAKYARDNDVRLAGVIYNGRSCRNDVEMVRKFADRIGSTVIGEIPMSDEISRAESQRKTVVELFPDGAAAAIFRCLAEKILSNEGSVIPVPMPEEELELLCRY